MENGYYEIVEGSIGEYTEIYNVEQGLICTVPYMTELTDFNRKLMVVSDGYFYDLATPTTDHQRIQFHLSMAFFECIESHGCPCEVFIAPLGVNLDRDDKTMLEPDIFILCDHGESEDRRFEKPNSLRGEPDLVAEVLSPSTREKDCLIKMHKYLNAGVREYWLVDLKNEKVVVYCFDEDMLPAVYSFDDLIPVGISGGECSIDFSKISKRIRMEKERFHW